jgi:hypothetical protein
MEYEISILFPECLHAEVIMIGALKDWVIKDRILVYEGGFDDETTVFQKKPFINAE